MIVPVILSGGSGTRLWPLSTPERPKQFLALVTERTLFQDTLLRLRGLPGLADPIVVCNAAHRDLVAAQLNEIGVSARAIVLEPAGRNTAPAIGVAAELVLARAANPDPVLLVLPADHVIADAVAFRAAVVLALRAAEAGRLATFGIVPTLAETGYGYIEQGAAEGGWRAVARFVEKPDAATAERYLKSGSFLWNSGMFVFGAGTLLAELARLAPAIRAACGAAANGATADGDCLRLGPDFLSSPSDSIDYAVMEKTGLAAVVSLAAGWSDVGSFAALHAILPKDGAGNVLRGRVVAESCRGSYIHSTGALLAVVGLQGTVVVQTEAGVLAAPLAEAQRVKFAAEAASRGA